MSVIDSYQHGYNVAQIGYEKQPDTDLANRLLTLGALISGKANVPEILEHLIGQHDAIGDMLHKRQLAAGTELRLGGPR